MLGPWAVAGPAIAVGEIALADATWVRAMRAQLDQEARRLDELLTNAGLEIVGGTSLFRLVRTRAASEVFHHLGRAGIFVRRFSEQAMWLRFGLPSSEDAWARLRRALADAPVRRD
jgi:cobalamin biosynthetic protein CobC